MRAIAAIPGLFFCTLLTAQASLTAIGTPYTQDFNSLTGGTDGAAYGWTNNTTLTGWYMDEQLTSAGVCCDDAPMVEASYTSMNNTGSLYIYQVAGDCNIGGRPSGSSGTIWYGVRLRNNTGTAISSVYVRYYGEQWTIAENGANVNVTQFHYQTGTTVTSLQGGTWTAVAALNFTQLFTSSQSSGMGGSACGGTSAQCLALNGNLSANRTLVEACFDVTVPAGDEIMLRWQDVNNGANDHHLQLDDVSVWGFDVSCATVLPVEWTEFSAAQVGNDVRLDWSTASEQGNDYFLIERLRGDGVFEIAGRVEGNGTTSQAHSYSWTDSEPGTGTIYYRLRQVDLNGQFSHSPIRTVTIEKRTGITFNVAATENGFTYTSSGAGDEIRVQVFTVTGQLVAVAQAAESGEILLPEVKGIYFIRLTGTNGTVTKSLYR